MLRETVLAGFLGLLLPLGAGAQTPSELGAEAPSPADPREADEAEGPEVDLERRLRVTDAVRLALRNNLDLAAARIEPALADEATVQARGAFDPLGRAELGFGQSEVPTASTLQRGGDPTSDDWTYSTGVSGILPLGIEYSSAGSFERLDTSQTIIQLERQYTARWHSTLRLPLLRDLGTNPARARVRRSELSHEAAVQTFSGVLTDIVAGVENAYWELSAARAAENVAAQSLATAQDLLEQTLVQHRVGIVSGIAVVQAEAGVAERELNRIRASNRTRAAQDVLIDALWAPEPDVFEQREILTEPPRFEDYAVDIDQAVMRARRNRPDLERARTALELAEMETELAANQALPRFDLVASYTVNGLSGPAKSGLTDFLGNPVLLPDQGRSLDAFDEFFRDEGAKSYTLGARVEIPIGNTQARSTATQRRIEARRARIELRRLEQGVTLEIRDAARTLQDAAKAVRAAERRLAAAEESLRAEQERLRLGDSTPFQVLEFDEQRAEAGQQVIESLQLHQNARTAFDRVQGTLLDRHRIRSSDQLPLEP